MDEKLKSYNDWLGKKLADPVRAARYLNSASEDSEAMFLKALRKVAAAQNKPMAEIAEACGVSRESLYRMLSESGNPTSENRRAILGVLGFKSVVVPVERETDSPGERRNFAQQVADATTSTDPSPDESISFRHAAPLHEWATYAFGGISSNTNVGTVFAATPSDCISVQPEYLGRLSEERSIHKQASAPQNIGSEANVLRADVTRLINA